MKKIIRYRFFSRGNGMWQDYLLHSAFEQLHSNGTFTIVEDNDNPDYVIVHCFADSFRKFVSTYTSRELQDKVTIFFATEAIHPDFNLFDYCISSVEEDFRYLYSAERYFVFGRHPSISDLADLDGITDVKRQFCNFLYSYGGSIERTNIFHLLSEYKKVDSFGFYLNNMGNKPDRFKAGSGSDGSDENWFTTSIAQRRPYKFSIAFENSSIRGYVSEKIICSFLAGTIPIYWGDPTVHRMFHEESFINCHDYKNFEAVCERVKEIDQNDKMWLEMVNYPKLKHEYLEMSQKQCHLHNILADIFAMDKQDALVKSKGVYQRVAFHDYYNKSPYKRKLSFLWYKVRILSQQSHIYWPIKLIEWLAKKIYW